jgi:AbrB family looped-hinge helix DNA binding protein
MQTSIDELVKIQAKGLITIPKKFRDRLGMETNSLARIREEKGKLILEPVRTLPYPVRTYSGKDLDAFFAFDDSESTRGQKKKV